MQTVTLRKYLPTFIILAVFLAGFAVTITMVRRSTSLSSQATQDGPEIILSAAPPSLIVGGTGTVSVFLNPHNFSVSGADVVLSFPPELLTVSLVTPNFSSGFTTFLPQNPVDVVNRQVRFSFLTYDQTDGIIDPPVSGDSPVLLVTLRVLATAPDQAEFRVLAQDGATTDSNITSLVANQIQDVIRTPAASAGFTINSLLTPTSVPTAVPTLTPTPTRTPTPSPTALPTATSTPIPTSTLIPTRTPTPRPTSTPTPTIIVVPTSTPTPAFAPTSTPTPTGERISIWMADLTKRWFWPLYRLEVAATSSYGKNTSLEVVGFGKLKYQAKTNLFRKVFWTIKRPTVVTVKSSSGASATRPTTIYEY